MDPDPSSVDGLRILAESRGFFTRKEALGEGHADKTIARALRLRLWVRIRHGYYTFTDLWAAADDRERHLVRAHAVMHKLGSRAALSHVSAALEHKLMVWDVDLSLVHVTRLDGGQGRIEAGVHYHEGVCRDDDLVSIDSMLVVNRARAALETSTSTSTEQSLVVLDSVLRNGCTRDELEAMHEEMLHWPGMQHTQVAVRMADGRSESVGESRCRWLFYKHRLPAPKLQHNVYDAQGNLIGTTDFAWEEHGLLGEFDGRVKYGRLLRPGETPGDAVFREKVREDALREASNCGMVRIIWSHLYQDYETAARVRRLMRRRAA